jgi:hypothetical protein
MARGHRPAEGQVLLLADGGAAFLKDGWIIPIEGVALRMAANSKSDPSNEFEARVRRELEAIAWEEMERLWRIHPEALVEVAIADILCDLDPLAAAHDDILAHVQQHLERVSFHAD